MCILFIYRNPDADSESYRLILVSNRDEDIKRPALPAHYWENHPLCLGGKLKLYIFEINYIFNLYIVT